jgi:hypothetical protein
MAMVDLSQDVFDFVGQQTVARIFVGIEIVSAEIEYVKSAGRASGLRAGSFFRTSLISLMLTAIAVRKAKCPGSFRNPRRRLIGPEAF